MTGTTTRARAQLNGGQLLTERIAISEVLIRPKPDLGLAIGGPDLRPLNLDTPATEGHLTVLMAVPNGRPVRIPLTVRAHDIVDLLFQRLGRDPEPDANTQRQ